MKPAEEQRTRLEKNFSLKVASLSTGLKSEKLLDKSPKVSTRSKFSQLDPWFALIRDLAESSEFPFHRFNAIHCRDAIPESRNPKNQFFLNMKSLKKSGRIDTRGSLVPLFLPKIGGGPLGVPEKEKKKDWLWSILVVWSVFQKRTFQSAFFKSVSSKCSFQSVLPKSHFSALEQFNAAAPLLPPASPRVSSLSNQESQNPDRKIYFKTCVATQFLSAV